MSGYGIKCEAETLPLLNTTSSSQELPVTDMDLVGFLDMDDKSLSELTGGINASEWSSLFNGQLDGLDSLDPMTGIQRSGPNSGPMVNMTPGVNNNTAGMDVWLLHETQRLERQQKLQQQKLLELQQTLLKTEILKNQLQIATISQQGQSTVTSPLISEGGQSGGYNFSPPQPQQQRPSTVSRLSSSSGLSSPAAIAVSPPNSVMTPNPTTPLYDDSKPPSSPLEDSPLFEGDKRKVHNLIEKKYRCSINDRIAILRDKVARNCKDSKRLQKSAVLQKTIDFIERLEKTISRLEAENKQLKDAFSKATNKPRMPSFSSPPATPHTLISPKSHESEDSGHSSADDYLSDEMMSHEPSPNSRAGNLSLLASHLLQRSAPQYLMVVLLLAVFTVNPSSLMMNGPSKPHHGRSLNSLDTALDSDWTIFWGLWLLRAALMLLAFGWLTLSATPSHVSGSKQVVSYWRLRKQAERDMQNGEFTSAQECLEKSLDVIGRHLPSTYLGLTFGLLWSLFSHLLFQMMLGQWAVSLARLFLCGERKQGVTTLTLAHNYHLMHQINTASTSGCGLRGLNLYLALNALNFAESAGSPQPEHYFSLALHMSSLPLINRYYFHAFRSLSPGGLSPLKWVWSPEGRAYLESGEWRSEVKLGTRLFRGEAALPLYSVSRGFCKTLLCDSLDGLLLKEPSASVLESASDAFKWTLALSKELNSHLLSTQEGQLTALTQAYDSGFGALQWWSCLGLVACGWLSGGDPRAYYPIVEGGPGDETAVPSTLQLAFKTALTHKRGDDSIDVLLQLTTMTSNSLAASVSELLHDNFSSTENQLYRLGLLLATDWLLGVRVLLWETRGSQGVRIGYYQDLETLAKLVKLLPAGVSQLRMYKGCYQLLAGANPVTVQALLGDVGYSQLRRRALATKEPPSNRMVTSIGLSLVAPTSV